MIIATHILPIPHPTLDQVADITVILALIFTLCLKGLALHRQTDLGQSMARFNLILAIAYFGVILAYFIDFFTSQAWRYLARAAVLVSAADVIWELKKVYGGWYGLWDEAWASFTDVLPFGLGHSRPMTALGRCMRRLFRRGDDDNA